MGLFSKAEPVILKADSSAKKQLAALEQLRDSLPASANKRLEADIRALQAGIIGEDRILYELKNSHMDMFVLQDLYLEHDGLTAQIDFLVLTLQRYFIIECKNLYGDIEINNKGDFIRSFGGRKREGIYSPITQNQRHLELIRAMRRANRGLALNLLLDRDFDDLYRSLVVLANPKTVLNDRFAKREVKEKIIRADQLIATIKTINNEKGPGHDKGFRSKIQENAEWFLTQHKQNPVDYLAKYREVEIVEAETSAIDAESQSETSVQVAPAKVTPADADVNQSMLCPRCGSQMILRTAKRGERAGKQFYGCSNYPQCRGVVSVED